MDSLIALKSEATALHGRLQGRYELEPSVLRITDDPNAASPESHALMVSESGQAVARFAACFHQSTPLKAALPGYVLPPSLHYLGEGDIVRINPRRGELWVMYRRHARTNSMLLTERCNSWCMMCSQPPKRKDDSYLVDAWLQAIPLMSTETSELGFTGGEPFLIGDRFFELLLACKGHLPDTAIHVLSNGRLFNYLALAHKLASVGHPDLMIGIPLYSDIAWRHEFVVQAPGAFDQTIRGIINLARCSVRVEIRVVIHKHTIDRLPQLARFIARNLPFVEQVALMGLEPIGFARTNLNSLWIDPATYHLPLEQAVTHLAEHGIDVSIYNHQLCVLPEGLWPFARQSISDWKNIYLPVCADCAVQEQCTGFFHSATDAHSQHLKPVPSHALRITT